MRKSEVGLNEYGELMHVRLRLYFFISFYSNAHALKVLSSEMDPVEIRLIR